MGCVKERILLRRFLCLAAMAVVLAGCGKTTFFDVDKQDLEFANQFLSLVKAKNFDAADAEFDPKEKTADFRDAMGKIAALFPDGEPDSVELTNHNWFTLKSSSADQTRVGLEFQYHYKNLWILEEIALLKERGTVRVYGFHVSPIPDSLENINRFDLRNKPTIAYVFLALVIAIPIFILVTAGICIMTPMAKKKWLWLIFILIGVGNFSLNWTNGAWIISPLNANLLGSGWTRNGMYGPVYLTFAVPLGAIIFLMRRRRLDKRTAAP